MASPGIELLFNSVKSQIRSPQDSIFCVLHWQIVSTGYKCIGKSEKSGGENDLDEETEMLPEGWNTMPDLYVLRYSATATGATYILKVFAVDGQLSVHFWKDKEEKVSNMSVTISDHATEDFSSYKKALKQTDKLVTQFKKEILDTVKGSSPKSSPKSGSSRRTPQPHPDDDDPLRVPQRQPRRPPPEWADPDDPFSIGRADLDPFGRGGGGMLFDPMRGGRGPRFGMDPSAGLPSRLPRGAVPPGARFDPFGPPGTHPQRGPDPDPDHLPPPGYGDMFM